MKKSKREKRILIYFLQYFKHVAIVALDFSTNPEAREDSDTWSDARDTVRAKKKKGDRDQEIRFDVSRCIGFIFVAEVKSSIRMCCVLFPFRETAGTRTSRREKRHHKTTLDYILFWGVLKNFSKLKRPYKEYKKDLELFVRTFEITSQSRCRNLTG